MITKCVHVMICHVFVSCHIVVRRYALEFCLTLGKCEPVRIRLIEKRAEDIAYEQNLVYVCDFNFLTILSPFKVHPS